MSGREAASGQQVLPSTAFWALPSPRSPFCVPLQDVALCHTCSHDLQAILSGPLPPSPNHSWCLLSLKLTRLPRSSNLLPPTRTTLLFPRGGALPLANAASRQLTAQAGNLPYSPGLGVFRFASQPSGLFSTLLLCRPRAETAAAGLSQPLGFPPDQRGEGRCEGGAVPLDPSSQGGERAPHTLLSVPLPEVLPSAGQVRAPRCGPGSSLSLPAPPPPPPTLL